MTYEFVPPESIVGEGDNVHIFEARETNSGRKTADNSRCGQVSVKDRWCSDSSYSTKNSTRTKAAELANSGKNICGQCVGTFYAD